MRNLLENTFK